MLMTEISFQSLIETMDLFSTGVAIIDKTGRFLFWNSGAALITGISSESVVGQTFDNSINMMDVFGNKIGFDGFKDIHDRRGKSASLETWIETPVGILTHVRLFSAKLLNNEQQEQGFAVIFHDVIIEEVLGEALERITDQMHFDALTKLYNRETLFEDLRTHVENVKRAKYEIGVVFLDIDRFKSINDRFGHITGDSVLSLFGKLIKDSIRKGERAYRFGGDEFVILLMINTEEDIVKFMQRLEAGLYETKFPVSLDVTMGHWILKGNDTPHTALEEADKRMYGKKRVKKEAEKDLL
jgi:diguanylate cyclase (GGDEF)-like protein/PAS domain S-box-containing protein